MKKNIKFIKKIKNYLKDILKTMLFQAITLIILIWAISFAVSRPSSIPAWESIWWKFIQYFNNLKAWTCPSWQAISWFKDDLSRKCVTFEIPLLCWVDLYESTWVCTSVWIWNYSPDNNNTKYACTNKPVNHSQYISDWNWINNCWYSCIDWYTWINCDIAPNPYSSCTTAWQIKIATTIYSWCNSNDIIVCSWNWVWYTISACNIWSSISWLTSTSYWTYYQFGSDPCVSWYHLPAQLEWAWLISAWWWWNNWNAMQTALKLPFAGYNRTYLFNSMIDVGSEGHYWSSTFSVSYWQALRLNSSYIGSWNNHYTSSKLSIRCFKD